MSNHITTFINNSGLPITLETWQTEKRGLTLLNHVLVKKGEQVNFPSITNEWYLETYFNNNEDIAEWIAAKIEPYSRIGKFRNHPCASGNYSWMVNDTFDILYNKENNTATFIKK
jgi:hypothetical protein